MRSKVSFTWLGPKVKSSRAMSERKKLSHSSDLLRSPEGAGVEFLRRELKPRTENEARRVPKTFRVEKSGVVGRVQSLLPQLATAECELQERMSSVPPHSMDFENITEDKPHIEMDLALIPLGLGDEQIASDTSSSESEGETAENFPLKLPTNTGHKKRNVAITELPCR